MFSIKRDPGPCIIDDAPHETCCAPGSGGAIIAGAVVTPTSITVPTPTTKQNGIGDPDVSTPPNSSFSTKNYRGRDKREPPPSTPGA